MAPDEKIAYVVILIGSLAAIVLVPVMVPIVIFKLIRG